MSSVQMSRVQKFLDAAAAGDHKSLKAMLAREPGLARGADESGFTALHHVAGQDDPQMAELLIRAGASVAAKNDVGMTPLHIAQYASVIKVLVRHGANVNERADGGWTPLHVQAQEGYDTGALETMKALLEAGADPNLQDDEARTPMDFAKEREESEKVLLLRARGAKG